MFLCLCLMCFCSIGYTYYNVGFGTYQFKSCLMEIWMDGWVDECLDGRMDGRILMQLEDTLRPNAVSHHIIVDPGW